MAVRLESLPDEILCEIFSYFDNVVVVPSPGWSEIEGCCEDNSPKKILRSLSMVSERFSQLSQPLLYRLFAFKHFRKQTDGEAAILHLVSCIADSGWTERLRYVRELVLVGRFKCNEEIVRCFSSALSQATRATFCVYPNTGALLALRASGLRRLEYLNIMGGNGFRGPEIKWNMQDINTFFTLLCFHDGGNRWEARSLPLTGLQMEHCVLRQVAIKLLAMLSHFDIKALSLRRCEFRNFQLGDLSTTHITQFSIDSIAADDRVELGGLANLLGVKLLRVCNMHAEEPEITLHSTPQCVETLQLVCHRWYSLPVTFDCIANNHETRFPTLRMLEVYAIDLTAETLRYEDCDGYNVKGDYAECILLCKERLRVLHQRGINVLPSNLVAKLQDTAVQAWGDNWNREQAVESEVEEAV